MLKLYLALAISLECFGSSSIENLTKKAAKIKKAAAVSEDFQIPKNINRHGLGLGLGQTYIGGQFGRNGRNGITWDVFYNYSASYSFDLLTSLHHYKHKRRDRYVRLTGLAVGIKGRLFHFDAFSPFLLGGLGFYAPRIGRSDFDSASEIVFGAHLGAGADVRLNDRYVVGILGHYHNPFEMEEVADVSGYYSKLLITLSYTF